MAQRAARERSCRRQAWPAQSAHAVWRRYAAQVRGAGTQRRYTVQVRVSTHLEPTRLVKAQLRDQNRRHELHQIVGLSIGRSEQSREADHLRAWVKALLPAREARASILIKGAHARMLTLDMGLGWWQRRRQR